MFQSQAMETMRAYRMTGWGEAPRVTTVPVPEPGPGQILVRVAGCGLCRSDLAMREIPQRAGEEMGWRMPFTLGHETAGRVAALGPGATGAGEGDAVALLTPASCGACWFCVRGRESSCPHGRAGRGYGRDGGLTDFVLVEGGRDLLPLGDLDPAHAGPLTDAGATAYHAVRRTLAHLVPGSSAVVIGAGGLGAFAVQFLRLLSAARVIAVDPSPQRLVLRRRSGRARGDGRRSPPRRGRRRARLRRDRRDHRRRDRRGPARRRLRPGGLGRRPLTRPWFGTLPRDGEVFTFQGSAIADAQEVIALAGAGLIRNQVQEFGFGEVAAAYAGLASRHADRPCRRRARPRA